MDARILLTFVLTSQSARARAISEDRAQARLRHDAFHPTLSLRSSGRETDAFFAPLTCMRILAVDTTGAHASVAVLDGGALSGQIGVQTERPQHAERLLPTVDDLLGRLGLALEQIEGFAVAVGPGSFTGLRIGIATVEGLAYSLGRPVVGVSSLDATAYRFRHVSGRIVAWIQAYRGEIYAASYTSDGEHVEPAGPPRCELPERFLDRLTDPPAIVCGSGVVPFRDRVRARFGDGVIVADPSLFFAEEIARLGSARLLGGESAAVGELAAHYVRPSEAERQRDRGDT